MLEAAGKVPAACRDRISDYSVSSCSRAETEVRGPGHSYPAPPAIAPALARPEAGADLPAWFPDLDAPVALAVDAVDGGAGDSHGDDEARQ